MSRLVNFLLRINIWIIFALSVWGAVLFSVLLALLLNAVFFDGTNNLLMLGAVVIPLIDAPIFIILLIILIKELRQSRNELDQRVAERTSELDLTNRQLQSEIQERKEIESDLKREVRERRQAEESLREREEHLQGILQATPDPLVVYNEQGHPRYLNPVFSRVFGWSFQELEGRTIPFVPEDQKEITRQRIDEIYQSGEPVKFETQRLTKDGQTLDIMISAAIIKAGPGEHRGLVVNLTDITRWKWLEAQFQQAQKLEAVGTLAGGIAHDFNNLLMSIRGNVSLALMELGSGQAFRERLKNIERSVTQGAMLTKQLLGFARGGKYEVQPINLNALIQQETKIFGRTRKEISIREDYKDELWLVDADKGQIQQVLMNLYVNAWQAMPGGGELCIRTDNVRLDEGFARSYQVEPGRYVKIEVSDSGVGMDPATQKKIFEPFFTTKEMGRGTGLGLASTYGIIKHHGGIIEVRSQKNQGATFSIYLPASEAQEAGATGSGQACLEMDTGNESVLLIDDEEMIAEVGSELLESLGYSVHRAGSGLEAVAFFEENRERIDIVLLDLVMPGMGGGEVFTRLKAIDPEVKILLVSGYSLDGRAKGIMEQGCDGFIQKPFHIQELARKMREILDAD